MIAVHVADQRRINAFQPEPLFHHFQDCVEFGRVDAAAIEHQRPAAVGQQQREVWLEDRPFLLELEQMLRNLPNMGNRIWDGTLCRGRRPTR